MMGILVPETFESINQQFVTSIQSLPHTISTTHGHTMHGHTMHGHTMHGHMMHGHTMHGHTNIKLKKNNTFHLLVFFFCLFKGRKLANNRKIL
jgi:hypothetical protein